MGTTEAIEAEVVGTTSQTSSPPASERVIFDLRHESRPDNAGESAPRAAVEAAPQGDQLTTGDAALHGRVIVVTGGAVGAGREIALRFAHAGARVCVIGNDVSQLRETVELAGPSAAMVFLQCDVGSLVEIDGVVDFINRFDRPVDCVVHAATTRVRGTLGTGAVHDLDEQYLVNVRGPYLFTQRLIDRLVEAQGRVVFLRHGGDPAFAQHDLVAETIRAFSEGLRSEYGHAIAVSSIVAVGEVDDHAIADAVLHTVTAPDDIEVGEIRLRARSQRRRNDG